MKRKLFLAVLLSIVCVSYSADTSIKEFNVDSLNDDHARNVGRIAGIFTTLGTYVCGSSALGYVYREQPVRVEGAISSCVTNSANNHLGATVSCCFLSSLLVWGSVALGMVIHDKVLKDCSDDIWRSQKKITNTQEAFKALDFKKECEDQKKPQSVIEVKFENDKRVVSDQERDPAAVYGWTGSWPLDDDIEYLNTVSNSWTALCTHGSHNIAKINIFLNQITQLETNNVQNIKRAITKK